MCAVYVRKLLWIYTTYERNMYIFFYVHTWTYVYIVHDFLTLRFALASNNITYDRTWRLDRKKIIIIIRLNNISRTKLNVCVSIYALRLTKCIKKCIINNCVLLLLYHMHHVGITVARCQLITFVYSIYTILLYYCVYVHTNTYSGTKNCLCSFSPPSRVFVPLIDTQIGNLYVCVCIANMLNILPS